MATTRIMRAEVRHEGGHRVLVLPDDITLEGDEVLVSQDATTGEVTVFSASPQRHWQAVFEAIDSHGPIPDEEWEAFRERMAEARVSRKDRSPFGNVVPE